MNQAEVLGKIGVPQRIVNGYEGLRTDLDRIHEQQYRPEKQSAEKQKAIASRAEGILQAMDAEQAQIDKERDDELKAIDREEHQRTALPSRLLTDTDGEYAGKLHRKAIEETRAARDASLTVADLLVIRESSDLGLLSSLVDEAFENGSPDRIRRVGAAAEARMERLAASEQKKNNGQNGPAFMAWTTMQGRMKKWRADMAAQSPTARREQARGRHAVRMAMLKQQVLDGARLYRVETEIQRAMQFRGVSQ